MATGAKSGSNQRKNGGYSNYSADANVDMANDSQHDTFAILLIIILLVVLLLLIPLIAWMYIDVRQMELRVNKALTRIEGK
jgi:hypothetical protein